MKLCERCNRPLRSKKSQEVGMGPVCKKKHDREMAEVEFAKIQMNIDEVITCTEINHTLIEENTLND